MNASHASPREPCAGGPTGAQRFRAGALISAGPTWTKKSTGASACAGSDEAGRAAFYSYDWLEQLIGCPLTNGERVTPEWQVRVGDVVRMCPEGKGPPFAYVVKALTPPTALVLAVEDEGRPATTWAFALLPREGATRLVVRNRTAVEQGWQEVIEPGVMMMERGMLRGLEARAERSVR